jgi:hypothetical protein
LGLKVDDGKVMKIVECKKVITMEFLDSSGVFGG